MSDRTPKRRPADDASVVTVREIETKFAVPEDFVVPDDLSSGLVGGLTQARTTEMRTLYFDTPDLRLAREGITLRRRSGGGDDGWHLKLPRRVGDRDEIRVSSGARVPPAELRNLVQVYTRAEALRRVATLETTRITRALLGPAGDVVGEIVDDEVRVVDSSGNATSSFREIEVEAAADVDDPGALIADVSAKLTANGAAETDQTPKAVRALGPAARGDPEPPLAAKPRRGVTAGAAIVSHLRTNTRAFMASDVGVRRDAPDSVHQMRVAARRLRSTLRTFRPLLDEEWAATLSVELAWIADVLGEVRDREVLLARLRRHLDELAQTGVDTVAAAEFLATAVAVEMTAASRAVSAALRSRRYRRLVEQLVTSATAAPVTAAADDTAKSVVPALVSAAWRALAKRAGRLGDDSPDEDFHRARIFAKRTRYAAELAAPVLGKPARRFAKQVTDVQEVLGEHHDAVVAEAVIRRVVTGDAPAPVAFVLGLLAARERAAADVARHAFSAVWAGLDQPATRKWLGA